MIMMSIQNLIIFIFLGMSYEYSVKNSLLTASLVLTSTMSTGITHADNNMYVTHIETKEEVSAKELLTRAITHIKISGGEAVNDFSHKEEFINGNLYVFALSIDGRF